jgi:hypothetical protein
MGPRVQQHGANFQQQTANYQQNGSFGASAGDNYVGPMTGASPDMGQPREGRQLEMFSRKVFVGGLPPDIDQGEGNAHDLTTCI